MKPLHFAPLAARPGAGIFLVALLGFSSLLASDISVDLPSTTGKEATLNSAPGTTATLEPAGGETGVRIHSDFSGGGDWTQFWFKIPPCQGPLKTITVTARGSGAKAMIGVRDGSRNVASAEIADLATMSDQPRTFVIDSSKWQKDLQKLNYPIIGIILFLKKKDGNIGELEVSKISLETEE